MKERAERLDYYDVDCAVADGIAAVLHHGRAAEGKAENGYQDRVGYFEVAVGPSVSV